jgi:SAM-dependent methyltransferase
MAKLLPPVLKHLGVDPRSILDLACGEGTFAARAGATGIEVTGLDSSFPMLDSARRKLLGESATVRLVGGDMRALPFREAFDMVTCWYDSLNYLLIREDLGRAFDEVWRVLAPAGLFIFDVNTPHGLATSSRKRPVYVERDDDLVFEVHRMDFDPDSAVATMDIIAFFRDEGGWNRMREEHRERGYGRSEVRDLLEEAGFEVLAAWDSLEDMSDATPESPRIYVAARKRARTPGGQ